MTKAIELSQLGSNLTVDGNKIGIGTATPSGTLHLATPAPSIFFHETDAAADNRIWAYSATSEELVWQARNDSLGGGGNLFKMTRTGTSIDAFKGLKSGNTWLIADNTTRRVGIGTASPSSKLTIFDDVGGQSLLIEGASGNDVAVLGSVNGATNRAELLLKEGTTGGTRVRFTSRANTPSYILENNVGIGTDNPTGKLQVGSATGSHVIITENVGLDINDGAINLYQATSNANAVPFLISTDVGGTEVEKLRVTAAGNLLINHDSSDGSGKLQVFTNSQDGIDILGFSSGATAGGRLTFYRSKSAGVGNFSEVADGDSLGRIDWRGYNDDGTANNLGATIEALVSGAVNSTTDMPSDLVFKTSPDGGASPLERLRITSNGNVGIGTNNPDAKLDVNGTVSINRPANYWQNNTQVFFNDGTNSIGSIGHHGGFAVALTSNGYRNSSGQWTSHSASSNNWTGAAQVEVQPQGNIYFRTDSNKATGTSTNPTTRIHIDSLGRMRVGGATPLYALDVRGESMSGLEYKAISSENGVLARECAGFGHANDNSSGCGLECILYSNNIHNNWVAFDLFIRASSCATNGSAHSSAWFFYRCRVYANSGFNYTLVDSGGDTGSISISINDDGNVGTAIGLGSDTDARQFEVRMSRSGGQRSTLSVFVNSYPKIARFRRQP